jgi:hypothetical protein
VIKKNVCGAETSKEECFAVWSFAFSTVSCPLSLNAASVHSDIKTNGTLWQSGFEQNSFFRV